MMMLTISWQMTLIALLIIPLSMEIVLLVVRQSQKYFTQQQDYLGHVNGHVEEMFGGHHVMKAFNGEARSIAKFDGLNNTLYNSAWKSQFLSGLMFPIMNVIGNFGYVAIAIMGGYLAVSNAISVGDIQAFIRSVALVYAAHHPDRQHLQRAPADSSCRRTHLRVPGRGRGSS